MAKTVRVIIVGDAQKLQKELNKAGKAGHTFGQKIQRGARIAGLALAGTLAVAAKVGFDELVEGQKVAAQTNAVLKSTGGVAKVTAKDVDTLATALSRKSGIDDEVIASGENMLLTFKKVRNEVGAGNDVFDRATTAALDLSVAFGMDMTAASKTLGIALNDPIRGMGKLSKAGVTFDEETRNLITTLVEAGDTLGAQKIILAELESQVGGSAEAYGDTLPGQIGKAREAFANLTGSLMLTLLPAMTAVAAGAQRITATMQAHPKLAKAITVGIIALTVALLAASVAQMALNVAVLANPYVAATVAIIALAAGIAYLVTKVQFFRRHWQLLLLPLGAGVVLIATIVKALVRWGGGLDNIGAKIGTFIGWLGRALGPLRTFISLAQTAAALIPNIGGADKPYTGPGGGRAGAPRGGNTGGTTGGHQRTSNRAGDIVVQIDGREVVRAVQKADRTHRRGNGGSSVFA